MKFNIEISLSKNTGVYLITNCFDDRVYVGSAFELWHRYKNHLNNLVKNKHHSKPLQNFVNKYGIESLTFNLLEICNRDILIQTEQKWMDYYLDQINFNVKIVAGNNGGFKHTPESKRKLSIAKLGKPGHKPSRESIEKTRQANIGKKRSPEICAKMSALFKGRKFPGMGERMKQLHGGKKQSPDHVKKRTSQRIGTKHSEESKLKNRLTQLGRKQDPEFAKKRIELSLIARRKNKEERLKNQISLF